MKHLLMTTALIVGSTSFAFANNSDIDQTGSENLAEVTQSGGEGSASTVLQTGSDDIATVTQSDGGGTATNISDIQQLAGSGTQEATVTQTNSTNGTANEAYVLQDSTEGGNTVNVVQDGAGNIARATQGPGDVVIFTTPLGITGNSSDIDQIGSDNTATTDQIVNSDGGNNNAAVVAQDGTSNTAIITQGTGTFPDGSSNDNNNSASIDQMGIGGLSTITQGGESGIATSIQDGLNNTSDIVQSGGFPGGPGNLANVEQTGANNNSIVNQTSAAGDLALFPAGTNAQVTQNGNDNTSRIDQSPLGGHLAVVDQLGENLMSTINQSGFLNEAFVRQELSDQTSEVQQTQGGIFLPFGNTANVSQIATAGNTSFVGQTGALNSATVMQ